MPATRSTVSKKLPKIYILNSVSGFMDIWYPESIKAGYHNFYALCGMISFLSKLKFLSLGYFFFFNFTLMVLNGGLQRVSIYFP